MDATWSANYFRRAEDRGHRLLDWLDRGVDDQVVAIPWFVFAVHDLLPARQRAVLDIHLAGPRALAVRGLVRADELDFEQARVVAADHGALAGGWKAAHHDQDRSARHRLIIMAAWRPGLQTAQQMYSS
jgi:hypothetical protein